MVFCFTFVFVNGVEQISYRILFVFRCFSFCMVFVFVLVCCFSMFRCWFCVCSRPVFCCLVMGLCALLWLCMGCCLLFLCILIFDTCFSLRRFSFVVHCFVYFVSLIDFVVVFVCFV